MAEKQFRVIIAGGRNFSNYWLLKTKLDTILKNIENPIIVSGCASGADALGIRYARERGYKWVEYPAQWYDLTLIPCVIKYDKKGRPYNCLAGFNRNTTMALNADACVCFQGGSGTADMEKKAKEHGLLFRKIK